MGILGWIGIGAIFYAAAEYEHMNGWKWAMASVGISAVVDGVLPFSFMFILPAQFVLFLIFWWANAKRLEELEVDRSSRQKTDQSERKARMTAARELAASDPELAAREAKRAAVEAAEAAERKERVRRAREEREREEREQQEKRKQS